MSQTIDDLIITSKGFRKPCLGALLIMAIFSDTTSETATLFVRVDNDF